MPRREDRHTSRDDCEFRMPSIPTFDGRVGDTARNHLLLLTMGIAGPAPTSSTSAAGNVRQKVPGGKLPRTAARQLPATDRLTGNALRPRSAPAWEVIDDACPARRGSPHHDRALCGCAAGGAPDAMIYYLGRA